LNGSNDNFLDIGYTSLENTGRLLDEDGKYTGNVAISAKKRAIAEANKLVYSTGRMDKLACYYDGSSTIHVPGVEWVSTSGNSNIRPAAGVSIEDGYLDLTGAWSPAVWITTDQCK